MTQMNYYVLTYDRAKGEILEHLEYPLAQRKAALDARERAIAAHISEPDVEVVLLGAHSYDDLLKTHSRYFRTVEQIVTSR
jgi:hypothetical protein